MIPREEYKDCPQVGVYVTYQQVKQYHNESELENFNKFMNGQTCAISSNGEGAIYYYDYERWLRQGKLDHQQEDQGA